jgi:hypothetical protein
VFAVRSLAKVQVLHALPSCTCTTVEAEDALDAEEVKFSLRKWRCSGVEGDNRSKYSENVQAEGAGNG